MLEAIWLNRGVLIFVALVALFITALWRGDGPERAIAATFISSFLVDRAYHTLASGGATLWVSSDYSSVEVAHLAIDSLVMFALGAIAIMANRVYPLFIAGFQIVTLTSYFSRSILLDLHPVAYAILERGPSYLQILGFLVGVMAHVSRRRSRFPFRSWRS